MKIRMSLNALNEALAWASIVKPGMVNNIPVYLFTVSDGRCYLHSSNNQYVRVEVATISMEDAEEGSSFVYPAERVAALKHVDGWIDIESTKEDQGGVFRVKYRTEGGANASRLSFDPKLVNTDENRLAQAGTEHVYPTILLREGISAVAPSLADKQEDNQSFLRTIQLFFDGGPDTVKGNGTLYATDKQTSCFFFSEDLKDKGLTIQDVHVGPLQSFLAKCRSKVKVKTIDSNTYVIDQIPVEGGEVRDGAVFGWGGSVNKHTRYKYYGLKNDKFVLLVPRDIIVKSLEHVKYELKDANTQKVRVIYANNRLKFVGGTNDKQTVESTEVSVTPLPLEDGTPSKPEFAANANVDSLLKIFGSSKVNEVEFRVFPNVTAEGREPDYYFRTLERFFMGDSGKIYINSKDAQEPCYGCWVTRFSTTMS